ncbi:zinc metalloproteinase [Asbolus verrucosus]|uniref:Zinc metalloproteinase n=1 Tax=Asbolus verrucosus TaxID=1661398 RepID=A0A482VG75_ASBVE|nr:zinc metalloproteinase [Asbolus verrucosus]
MACNHEIMIDNFNPEETVHYSVIIIKGHVKNKPKSTCQTEQIYVNPGSTNSYFKIVDGKFKVLSELKLGQNSIILKYCCLTTTVFINYAPRQSNLSVLPLYIICEGHDGKFQAPETQQNDIDSACKRITLCSKLLQSVIAEKLNEQNQRRKTFKLEDDCRVFRSKLNYLEARKMTQEELWTSLGREIANSDIGREEIKFLGFLSCTKYCGEGYEENFFHDDIVKLTQAYVALGGGGLALFGTACLYTWPEDVSHVIEKFEDCSLIDRRQFMDDSCYRGTFGACFSTTLGSVLHELCHTFDLGHTGNGIMGRGFDDIYKVFVSFKSERSGDIRRTFQNSIEFEEKFDTGLLSDRLAEKKKGFSVKDESSKIEQDGTFWTRSCLTFLSYHKWMNDFEFSKNDVIKFDPVTKFLSSIAGLRVIELRNENDGMVIKDWIFDGKVLKYSFQVPEDELNNLSKKSVMLVVEDNIGNILKHVVNI